MRNFIPTNVARIVFALTMAFFGLNHFLNAAPMSGILSGWPLATFFVYLSGVCLVLAAVAFIINKQVKLSGYLLALMLVIIVISIHVPGIGSSDAMVKMYSTSATVKDTAIAAAAIVFANTADK